MSKESTIQNSIYIELLNEGIRVFRPVKTIDLGNHRYVINEIPPSDETWAFDYGDIVTTTSYFINGEQVMVAVALINESE